MTRRTERLNSLLREVLSETIREDLKHADISPLFTVTRVDITTDLHHAKVYVSVIGTPKEQKKTLENLEKSAKYIAVNASKKVRMRFFPELSFYLDDSAEKHHRIETLLQEALSNKEKKAHPDSP
jgi:ribosome-binding factor A